MPAHQLEQSMDTTYTQEMWISGENNAGKRFNSVDNIIDNSRDIKNYTN